MKKNVVMIVVGVALGVGAGALVCRYAPRLETNVAAKSDRLETGGASAYEKNGFEAPVAAFPAKDTSSLSGR